MKKLLIYYSYSGNSKKIAEALAEKDKADIYEVTDLNKPGKIAAYVLGSFSAMRMKAAKIKPITVDMSLYDIITIISPIWAGNVVPQINAVLEILPANKKIELILVSASGQNKAEEKLRLVLKNKNCELIKLENIKA